MSFVRLIPVRVWVMLAFLVAGIFVGRAALSHLDGMRTTFNNGDPQANAVMEQAPRVVDNSLGGRARAASQALLKAVTTPADRKWVTDTLASTEQAMSRGATGIVTTNLSLLEGYAVLAGLECEMHAQKDGRGRIKAIAVGENSFRLSMECRTNTAEIVYPTLLEMMPVVSATTLSRLQEDGGGAVGRKLLSELRIRWDHDKLGIAE